MRIAHKISDILRYLSVNQDQLDNNQDQWARGEFYLDVLNYKEREVKLDDVVDMIMEVIRDEL